VEGAPCECENCGAELRGLYCHTCGASSQHGNDRSFRSFLRDAGAEITDVESSKLWRTVRILLFKPGFLSLEHFTARRARYLKPINLFLVIFAANIVAYTAGNGVSMYDIKPAVQAEAVRDAKQSNYNPLLDALERKVAREGNAERAYDEVNERWRQYASYSQIPMVLFFSLLLQLIFRRRYLTENLTFGLHFFSFQILTVILMWPLYYLVGLELTGPAAIVTLAKYSIDFSYLYVATRRFYGLTAGTSLVTAIGLIIGYYLVYLTCHMTAMSLALWTVAG
jgi:hypothetical protein